MAKKKTAAKRRTTYIHVGKKTKKEIARVSKFVPSLSKLKNKSRITSGERAQLTRASKRLRYTENLRPVTEKQAKILKKKGLLVGNGIRAIRLNNTASNAKITVKKDGIIVTSNGEKWEYHTVDADPTKLAEYGEKLLARDDVVTIHLWTTKGRASAGFTYPQAWFHYLQTRYENESGQPGIPKSEFVNGIAAMITDVKGEKYTETLARGRRNNSNK